MSEKLVLIDGHSIIHRAYYGVPDLTNAEGLHTNAIFGFLNIMFRILDEEKPDYLAVAFDLNVPTTKTASALLCMTKDEVSAMEPSPCINCGRCVEVCPGRVVPKKLAVLAQHYDEEAFIANDGMECCECGCCSYICPAKRQLTQSIKSIRKTILVKNKK